MPIIAVNENESAFKQLKEELEEWKRKHDRLLNEKNELKLLNNQLDAKLVGLQTEYLEEHAANAGTADLLEVESSERARLEKELNELRVEHSQVLKKLETLEADTLELRLNNTKASIEQEIERVDLDLTTDAISASTISNGSSTQGEAQFGKLKIENETLRKHLKQLKKENAHQQFSASDRDILEKAIVERDNQLIELDKQSSLYKFKYQKLFEEMQDLQRMCDESKLRNKELEKQQKKFDSDMATWRLKYENEKEMREKCERERDATKFEVFTLKSEYESIKLENSFYTEKCERLEKDLKEYEMLASGSSVSSSAVSTSASTAGSSFATGLAEQIIKLKSQVREMESKLKDQEEELDEQCASIQQLEQAKLRLEMQLEKEKQKWHRELAEKESEMDELRFHTQKKIKAIEMQLEEESELSNSLQRDKRDLERKLREIAANGINGSSSFKNSLKGELHGNLYSNGTNLFDYIAKLKRNMLKYKTLAIDAQIQLEKLKETMPKQSIIKSLKSQLEDTQIAKANALKQKQLLQVELSELQQQFEEVNSTKQHVIIF
jgi:myosin XVIII